MTERLQWTQGDKRDCHTCPGRSMINDSRRVLSAGRPVLSGLAGGTRPGSR